MLFHKDVYLPKEYEDKANYFLRRFNEYEYNISYHTIERFNNRDKKHDYDLEQLNSLLNRLSTSECELFEVEVENDRVVKYCIRTSFDDERDIAIAIMPKRGKNFIKTAWLNYKTDNHYTLDESKYEKEN